jgi:hypothetical protein
MYILNVKGSLQNNIHTPWFLFSSSNLTSEGMTSMCYIMFGSFDAYNMQSSVKCEIISK